MHVLEKKIAAILHPATRSEFVNLLRILALRELKEILMLRIMWLVKQLKDIEVENVGGKNLRLIKKLI